MRVSFILNFSPPIQLYQATQKLLCIVIATMPHIYLSCRMEFFKVRRWHCHNCDRRANTTIYRCPEGVARRHREQWRPRMARKNDMKTTNEWLRTVRIIIGECAHKGRGIKYIEMRPPFLPAQRRTIELLFVLIRFNIQNGIGVCVF